MPRSVQKRTPMRKRPKYTRSTFFPAYTLTIFYMLKAYKNLPKNRNNISVRLKGAVFCNAAVQYCFCCFQQSRKPSLRHFIIVRVRRRCLCGHKFFTGKTQTAFFLFAQKGVNDKIRIMGFVLLIFFLRHPVLLPSRAMIVNQDRKSVV